MTVAINGENLITLTQYKEQMEITTTTNDAKLNALITSVSQLVKTYCANSFLDYNAADKTESISIHDKNVYEVILTESPIISVSMVEIREATNEAYTTLTPDDDYSIDLVTDSLFRLSGGITYKAWPTGPASVKVTYRAGYVTLPADLKLAVVDLVTYYHKEEHKVRQSLAGGSLNNSSSSSQPMNVGFPDHIKRVLDLYKNTL